MFDSGLTFKQHVAIRISQEVTLQRMNRLANQKGVYHHLHYVSFTWPV